MSARRVATAYATLLLCRPAAALSARASPPYVGAREVAAHLWTVRDLFETSIHAVVRCNKDGGPSKYRLAYMPCRNRGEILRLMLEEAGVSYVRRADLPL